MESFWKASSFRFRLRLSDDSMCKQWSSRAGLGGGTVPLSPPRTSFHDQAEETHHTPIRMLYHF